MLKNFNQQARGGQRRNSGPKTNWVRQRCEKIVKNSKLLEFLRDVAEGKIKDHKMTKDGGVIEVEAGIHDRTYAATYLVDQGGGKAFQSVMMTGDGGGPVSYSLVNYAPETVTTTKKPDEAKK